MNRNRFDALSTQLSDLLEVIECGKMQLPDFQRGWVWDDTIRSLIASVSQTFPIGSIMTLETGNPDVCFKARVLEGVDSQNAQSEPDEFILDGQQRLTALFQCLMSSDGVYTLDSNNKPIIRHYYLDMEQCVKDDIERERAVLSCRKDQPSITTFNGKKIDLSASNENELVEKQFEHAIFPVYQMFDADDWGDGYKKHWEEKDPLKKNVFNQFNRNIIEHFKQYTIPVIRLRKDTSREAVCIVFEKVNTKGVTLTVFELLTASFAAKNFLLRDDWKKRAKFFKKIEVLRRLDSTSFLRAISLLIFGNCKRGDILNLSVEDYKKVVDKVQKGFEKAAEFLNKQSIYSAIDVPYQTQLVPLAAILASLGDDGMKIGPQNKIARWYWCGVFGEMYAGSTDTQASVDFSEVTEWVKKGENEPTIFRDADFKADRILELRSRGSAAYKGCYAVLVSNGCHDFLMEKTAEDMERKNEEIDIHHIFPVDWCKKKKIEKKTYDNIINKTPLSRKANRMIGNKAPSVYLYEIQQKAEIDSTEKMDEILSSHLISADDLRSDEFNTFFEKRKEALLNAIEIAMGKSVNRESVDMQVTSE